MVRLVTYDDKNFVSGIIEILNKVNNKIQQSGKLIRSALLWSTKNHFKTIYPDSTHYSPNKVEDGNFLNGELAEGEIEINVAGITRAFHPVIIKPRYKQALTIPLHRDSYGKQASDFNGLFRPIRKNVLAQNENGKLKILFALCKSVYQEQDRRLLPEDQEYSDNVFSRINAYLSSSKL